MENYPCLPLHEQLIADLEFDVAGECMEKMNGRVAAGELPPCYWEHPAVLERKHDEPLSIPICTFVDALSYSLTDSILGWCG